ncbi:hypothetical protein [Nocardia jiangsuensis]|uniref:Uncharacterized protein n=1 Tax=Nocardia jiangsuensis TaxID=1691563 RepID=A0ABV8DUB4_9NOCA
MSTALGSALPGSVLLLTVAYAMLTGAESASVAKALFLVMIVGGVVGLQPAH